MFSCYEANVVKLPMHGVFGPSRIISASILIQKRRAIVATAEMHRQASVKQARKISLRRDRDRDLISRTWIRATTRRGFEIDQYIGNPKAGSS